MGRNLYTVALVVLLSTLCAADKGIYGKHRSVHASVATPCNPTTSVGLLIQGSTVTSYVPNGNFDVSSTTTGLQVVPLEPTGSPVSVATANVVNSCVANSTTGEAVCTANNTDVYTLMGSTLTHTLTSSADQGFNNSGGTCFNCGVIIDMAANKALISIGLSTSPSGSAYQYLDLTANTFATPIPTVNEIAENFLYDSQRALLLSPTEAGVYDIFKASSGSLTEYEMPLAGSPNTDSAGEDCTTGISLVPVEFSSNLYLSDLTQAVFTPGSPGTWTAPTALINIPEWTIYDGPESGLDGVAIAGTTHLGIVLGEYPFPIPPNYANAVMVVQLPSTSGSGTPALVDYAVALLPNDPDGNTFSIGCDPHTVAAYVSPNSGKALGVVSDYGALPCYTISAPSGTPQYEALIDLAGVLAAPRTGGHTVTGSISSFVTFVATH